MPHHRAAFSPTPAPGKRRGFALLITITLLAFLVLLLVSLASLTRVETRIADNGLRLAQARANALFALNVALGQLQHFTGPDQRVTAAADLGDGADNNLPVPSDGTRQWIGVWGNANAPTGDRDAPVFLDWLVSGNTDTAVKVNADGSIASAAATPARTPDQAVANLASATALSTDVTIGGQPARLLVGPGSVGTAASGGLGPAGYVAAPLVSIEVPASSIPGQSGGSRTAVGRYAWWIGDEGVKARANLVEAESSISATAGAGQRLRYRTPARTGIELMSGAPAAFAGADMEAAATVSLRAELLKVFTSRQLALTGGGVPFPATFLQRHFHDLSAVGQGVLSDTLAGGLRRDLTAAFAPGTTKADAPTGPIWQVGPTDYDKGPDWQLLRSYYQLPFSGAAGGPGDSLSLAPRPQIDGTTDAGQSAQQGVFPVVAFWQMFVEGRISTLSVGNCGLELRYYPAIVLWNPYNVTLKDHTYHVTYSLAGGDVTFIRVSARTDGATYSQVPPAISAEAQVGTPWVGGMQVAVQSGDMEPGAAYVYTLQNNVYYSTNTFTPYTLKRGWNAGGARSVIVSGNSFPLPGGDNSRYMVSFWRGTNSSGGANTIPSWSASTQTVPSQPIGPGQTEPSTRDDTLVLATDSGEPLQTVTQNNNYDDAFKMRWVRDTFLYQSLASYPAGPAVVGFTGHRWALKPTAPGTLSLGSYKNNPVRWLADYNPRAPYASRTPYEMQNTNLGEGYFHTNPSYDFKADVSNGNYGTGAFDPVNAGAAIPCDSDTGRAFVGMSQDAWDGPGGSTVVLFNVPRADHPVVSLGEFQHAQLYRVNGIPFASNAAPAYAFGNSLAQPRGSLDAPSLPWSAINIGANGFSAYQSQARVYDDSYLLNRALWDGCYLSTVPRGASASDPVAFPLPNPRLVLHERAGASLPADLRDYRKSAASLLVNGAFNINSTSVEAWKALLGGLNNVPVGATRRSGESPYPRLGYPFDDSVVLDSSATGDAGAKAAAYDGYRWITHAQIESLAAQIVLQVRRRGPFVSLADFVNRSLSAGPVSGADNRLRGALAQAIADAGINAAFSSGQQAALPDKGGSGSTAMVETAAAGPTATGVPGWLTQADLLQPLGPSLSARSDTFVIRACGESLNPALASTDAGYVQGRAWCEAVVQRMPGYVSDADDPWTPVSSLNAENQTFGRRFRIVAFRWLDPGDI